MVALVNFTPSQSAKYLRITSRVPSGSKPETSGLLTVGKLFPVKVGTFDETIGLVKVEVSTDGKSFATHDERMRVVEGPPYEIDDSKLPQAKKQQPTAA